MKYKNAQIEKLAKASKTLLDFAMTTGSERFASELTGVLAKLAFSFSMKSIIAGEKNVEKNFDLFVETIFGNPTKGRKPEEKELITASLKIIKLQIKRAEELIGKMRKAGKDVSKLEY